MPPRHNFHGDMVIGGRNYWVRHYPQASLLAAFGLAKLSREGGGERKQKMLGNLLDAWVHVLLN